VIHRGKFYDDIVADIFFQLLKRERIRRRIYTTHEYSNRDNLDYIVLFYNTRRKYSYNHNVQPVKLKGKCFLELGTV